MTDALTILDANPSDAERIAAIHVASWQATYRGSMPETYLDALSVEQRLPMWAQAIETASAGVRIWVASRGGEIVGFCSVGPPLSATEGLAGSLVLHTIYLDPNCQRQGIGRALLRHAEREAAGMGAATIGLWVLEANDAARRFYEAAGWTDDGIAKQDEVWGQTVREVRYSKRLA